MFSPIIYDGKIVGYSIGGEAVLSNDFASAGNKKSLKKLEIEMGIHHQELGLPWDKPVPEKLTMEAVEYCKNDVIATKTFFDSLHGVQKHSGRYPWGSGVENVIFNDPATIVFWNDGTKTVVKAQNGEAFDPEKGLAMAICKKMIGKNTGRYYETFKKWLPNANNDSLEEPTSIDLVSMFLGAFMTPPEEDNENEKDN